MSCRVPTAALLILGCTSCSLIFDSPEGASNPVDDAAPPALRDASLRPDANARVDATVADASTRISKSLTVSVDSSEQDAEERDGSVNAGGTTLDFDGSTLVGLRFRNINIPQGSTIQSASIRFTAALGVNQDPAVNTDAVIVVATDSAAPEDPPFGSGNTMASRMFAPPRVTWQETTKWIRNMAYETEDLSPLIQFHLSDQNWNPGPGFTLVFTTTRGSRDAYTFDGSANSGVASFRPTLTMTYLEP